VVPTVAVADLPEALATMGVPPGEGELPFV
jgi:hypothetical protein